MNIIRLHVTAEGQTEQTFVKRILAKYLAPFNISTDARSVLTSKDNKIHKEFRGGLLSYQKAKMDIVTWMKEDNHPECRFTTMFDLYALPDDFPGYQYAKSIMDPYKKVNYLEKAFADDMNDYRFIPYIQLHEFETLLFADMGKMEWEYLEHEKQINELMNVLKFIENKNPELINDNPESAPSKRIINVIPEYDKVTAGVSIVEKIGIEKIMESCQHFKEWVDVLKQTVNEE